MPIARRRGRSRLRAGLSGHHRSGHASATGIRRSRSTSGACAAVDEDYWKQYRTTPKAFIPLEVGQALWRSRYGDRTSVRLAPPRGGPTARRARDHLAAALRAAIDPLALGLSVRDVRARGPGGVRAAPPTSASTSPTSASSSSPPRCCWRCCSSGSRVEQRAREVGLLARGRLLRPRGSGGSSRPRGSVLAVAGSADRAPPAPSRMRGAMMAGCARGGSGRSSPASLTLHVSPASLGAGAAGALARGDDLHLVDAARARARSPSAACWRDELAG